VNTNDLRSLELPGEASHHVHSVSTTDTNGTDNLVTDFNQHTAGTAIECRVGGNRIGNKGYFFEPTVVAGATTDMRAMNEEPFGPVALMRPFKDLAEVVGEANRLPFGLASYAFTTSGKTAQALAAGVEVGMMTINHLGLALPEVPFGGVRDSGYGTEGGSEAIEAYLNTKFVSQFGL
jgi:succinate-semialdehyde dehydrogenase/glutarate-semialdehyde dehydrogenase